MWILWKKWVFRKCEFCQKVIFWECEFCEKWDFENVNFVKKWDYQNVIFWMNCGFLPQCEQYRCPNFTQAKIGNSSWKSQVSEGVSWGMSDN